MTTINLGKVRLNWRGTWSGSTAYDANDSVYYDGSSYVCVTAHTNQAPMTSGTVGGNWNVAAQGSTSVTTTRGDIVFRGASGLERLPAGADNTVLTSRGPGRDPQWTDKPGRYFQSAYTGTSILLDPAVYPGSQDLDRYSGVLMNNRGPNSGDGPSYVISPDRKSIKSFGYNWQGVLGYNHMTDTYSGSTYPGARQSTPQYCQFVNSASTNGSYLDDDEFFDYVRRGRYQAFAVTTKGKLFATGYNNYGQLGTTDTTNRYIFTQIQFFGPGTGKTVRDVRVMRRFSGSDSSTSSNFVLTQEGELYGTGYNAQGQLGQGDTTNRSSWTRIGASTLNGAGATIVGFAWSQEANGPAYNNDVIAWNSNYQVWGWGRNYSYGLGLNDSSTQQNSPVRMSALETLANINSTSGITIKQVMQPRSDTGTAGSRQTTMILTTAGQLYSTGRSNQGQLGIGGADSQDSQIYQLVTRPTGKVWEQVWAEGGTNSSYYALTTDKLLYSWGYNGYGQLGFPDTTNRQTPTLITGMPTNFQGNITGTWVMGDTGYVTVYVRALIGGKQRWCSFGWSNYGAILHSDRYIPEMWNTTNYAREITGFMPNQGEGVLDFKIHNCDSTSSAMILMEDGRLFWIGYRDGNLQDGTTDGSNYTNYNYYPMQVSLL